MFMRDALDSARLRLSPGMWVALVTTAAATIFIGVFPEWFIKAVNWTLPIAQDSLASLVR